MTTSSFSSDDTALGDHYALDIIKGNFLRDFDMRDVLPCLQDIFSKLEEQYINAHLQCDNECTQNAITDIQDVLGEEKASRLFAVLRNKNYAQIRKFMEVLSSDYLWLVSHFDNVNKVDHSNYVDLVHSLHSKVSLKYEDYNVHRSMPFRKLRNALLTMPMQGRVILASDFGYGKKWLAVDVCTDFDVAKAMNFQIYWIDMSECTSALDDLRMLRYLKLLLTQSTRSPSPAGYGSLERPDQNTKSFKNSIDEYKHLVGQELRKNSHEKCLVVLVNVRNTHALEVFDLPCKLLVLTRSKKVSDSFAKKRSTTIRLTNGLTRAEFYMLFEKYLGQQNLLEKYMDLIYAHSNEHPYLLSLIGQSLRQNLANWQDWIDKLRESKFFDDKFNAAIEKSLDSLEPELRKTFMKTFSCFPHAIYVPQRLIAALWPAGKCEKDLEKLYYRHGFLEKLISPYGEICYKQLFVYGKTKQNDEVSAADMVDMHKKLLNYYHLVEDLARRSEVLPFRRDMHGFYFFSCIGYHINKSGLTDYFRQLYLDFGFLEQKIRNVDLLSTIADLETYQEYIAVDLQARKLLRALLKFLPNIEKTLQESSNTTLLQCAFMEDGLVGIEARKQAAAFPNFAWFEQHGCIHQRQNIVPLPSAPKKVLLLDQERSLIALQESSAILLINITFDWNTYTVKLKEPTRSKSNVVDIRFFRDNNSYILLALYDNGNMNVWSLQGDCNMYRRRSHSFARPAEKEIECRNFIPIDHLLKPISAFDFSYGVNTNPSNLYLAYKTGEIRYIEWNSENEIFVPAPYECLKTGMADICLLRIVFNRNYIVCNKAGDICIFDVLDYSHLRGIETFKHLIETIELTRNELLLICRRCIVHFTSRSINQTGEPNYLLQERDITADDAHNAINCAKLLHINGHKQLLLGTKKGLIMFDIETRTKVLTTNVNEDITCVDIQPLDVVKNKYIVACGSNAHKFLNLFALRTNAAGRPLLSWSGSSKTLRTQLPNLDLQMPPYVSLKGGKLYTVQYEHDAATLLAVDSQNQLHKIDASGHARVYETAPDIITAITQYGERSFIGCANGVLVYLSLYATAPAAMQQVFTEQPIEFLQLLDEHTLIAAGANEFVVFTNLNYGVCKRFPMLANSVMRCFHLPAGQILILFTNRAFSVLDECANLIYNYIPKTPVSIGGCDLQNNQLFIVTENYKIEVFDIAESLGPKQPNMTYNAGDMFRGARVSCIAVSRKANLLAVACYTTHHNGEDDISIHVYDCQLHAKRIDLLYTLNGHAQRVNSMRFSPNAYVLVSCAEQLCWWSLHMAACKLNNAIANTRTQQRRSGLTRFPSDSEDEDAQEEHLSAGKLARILEDVSLLARNDTRPPIDVTPVDDVVDFTMVTGGVDAIWKSKCGPATNCELLACVKFNGNEALQFFANEAFTKFQTIDNGGSYYVLTLHDFNAPLETCESVIETSSAVADCDVVT
uniref:Apoptotic protease-activating factor 1 n=1 Tax=Bactrocera latifrons TaxID=174628 RepID=A0A0K8W1M1_BACLA